MFEIPETEATGRVAEIYDDIRQTLDMSMVNTIWRSLALKEEVFRVGLVFFKADLSKRLCPTLRI